jgi:hypothetical protein
MHMNTMSNNNFTISGSTGVSSQVGGLREKYRQSLDLMITL